MENQHRGEIGLSINGRSCTILFDWNAIAALQSAFGKEWYPELGERLGKDMEFTAQVLAIGLARHHPDMTAQVIFSESPPVIPVITAVMRGINLATLGVDNWKGEEEGAGAGGGNSPPPPRGKIGSRRGGK